MFDKVNLEKALHSVRKEREDNLGQSLALSGFKAMFEADWERESEIRQTIQKGSIDHNLLDGSKLPESRKFELEDVKKLCVKYRLRFLSTKHFNKEIPAEAISAIKGVEDRVGAKITSLSIAAPAAMFNLTDVNTDPLLFAPLEDGRFYLIHKWGGDLSWFRSLIYWPMAKLSNLMITIFSISLIFSAVLPTSFFSNQELAYFNFYRVAFLIWNVAFMSGMISYFWFATNRKFSVNAWNSKHFN